MGAAHSAQPGIRVMGSVIEMDRWRAARRPMARTLCKQSETMEAAYLRGIALCFAWQRIWIRAFLGV